MHGSLGQFDLATGDWQSYVERAKLYFIANDTTGSGKKRAVFLSSCGDATYRRIKDVFSPRSLIDIGFDDMCTAMTTHLQPQPFEIVQHFRFNTRSRQPHESIATYVTQLKRLAETCNFSNYARLNEMMRDGLVCGVAIEVATMLAEDNLTYDKAFKLLLSMETSKKEAKNLSSNVNGGSLITQVHKLNRHARQHSTMNPQVQRDDGTGSDKTAKNAKPSYRCEGGTQL